MKFRKDLPEAGSGGNFLKLKDKESVTGIFRGDIYEFFGIFKDRKYMKMPEGSPGAKFRFQINFVVKEGASYVPKIFEQGQMVYEQLAALHEEYNLETTVIKITRNGLELDTTYTLFPLREPVTQATEAVLRTLKLNKLGDKGNGSVESPPDFGPEPTWENEHAEIPF